MAGALKADGKSPNRSPLGPLLVAPPGHGLLDRFRRIGARSLRATAAGLWLGGSVALVAADADAMGLGAATVSSGLGEPLRLSFPVSTRPDEEVGCVQVRPKGDDLPSVFNTRTAVIRNGFQTRVEVRSAQPVNEPAVGLVIQVGCASPIAREYILFLDPPAVAPVVAMDESTIVGSSDERRRARGAPTRRAAAPIVPRPPRRVASAAPRPTADAAPARAPRLRSQPSPAAIGEAPRAAPPVVAATPVVPAPIVPQAPPARDRLTVVPSGPSATAPAATPVPAPVAPDAAARGPATPPATAPSPVATTPPPVATTPPAVASTPPSVASTPPPVDAGETLAREQALQKQQSELQQQIRSLGSQIAALQAQTTTLVSRNQVLEESTVAPWLLWLLAALAIAAILVAGWMGWRYAQLRRSVDGATWWTANTGQAPLDSGSVLGGESRSGLVALDSGTRLAPRPATQTDMRASVPPSPPVPAASNGDRSRPAVRNERFPAAIDTDFTVSDIEAAMATVRTVSPPRDAPRQKPGDDADLAPLGGPSMPSPFTAPPPPSPTTRTGKVADRGGDDGGRFVDLEIPAATSSARPVRPTPPVAPRPAAPVPKPPVVEEESAPLDFKLDIPESYDPLATTTMTTTVVDPKPARPIDFEVPASPSPLDFELPGSPASADGRFAATDPFGDASAQRHGATALADLFASQPGQGVDEILANDEREGAALSTTGIDQPFALATTGIDRPNTTEVTGLTSTAVDAPKDEQASSTRARLARFADMMNQVDEVAAGDPLRAIAQLRQHVLRDENIPTLLWLRLFQLYQTVDKKPVYEALAEHFSRRYHRPMLAWNQQLSDRVPQTPLSAMAHIDTQVEALWGKEDGLEKIRSLLCDRDQDDAVVFNAVLQRDLLDAAKVFPPSTDSMIFSARPPPAA